MSGFSTVNLLFFPFSILYSLEGSHYTQSTFKAWAVMFHLHLGDYQHTSFGILLHGSFIYSLPCAYLFDHLFVSVLTHGGLFYILFYYVYITYLHIFIYIHFITYYIYLVYFIYIYFTIISLSIFILRHDKS